MHTHGPVVVDAFHQRFLLQRQRDPQAKITTLDYLDLVDYDQRILQGMWHSIELHDRLVCDLIRVNGSLYEDLVMMQQARVPEAKIQEGFAMLLHYTNVALDSLDVMPKLFLGEESLLRINALQAGLTHNMAVAFLERGEIEDGRETAREGLSFLAPFTDEQLAEEELATTIIVPLRTLVG